MSHSYDFFVAHLTCPVCGETSPADESTNMQTYIRDAPDMAALKVGDRLDIDPARIQLGDYDGYYVGRAPAPGEAIRLLQTWECPFCGTPTNWAEVVVCNGVIDQIEAVPFDREHVERSHLIGHDAISIAADLTGASFDTLVTQNIVQILRDTL